MSEELKTIKSNSGKGAGKLITLVLAGALTAVLLAGAFWYFTSKAHAQTGGSAPAAPAVKEVMHLEGFVVNLADPPGDCFLRIGIDLGLERSIAGHGDKDAGAIPTARVRDTILRILTTYRADDLIAPEGKIRLKQQLLKALQDESPELGVREVYFTDILVQR